MPAAVTPAPIEICDPPAFEPGQRVRALQSVRNDGTYPGVARGSMLIDAGDVGYVQSVGEFLQRYYIYAVDFYERGRIVAGRTGDDRNEHRRGRRMKVTQARRGEQYSLYVAKKDLEQPVIASERAELWGGWIELANGWRFALPEMDAGTRLPLTVEARRLAGGD